MTPNKSGSTKWGGLFSVAVVLMLLGAGFLFFYALNLSKAGKSNSGTDSSAFYTQAANTLAAMQTGSVLPALSATETPEMTLTPTGFPQFSFTPQDSPPPASLAATQINTQPVSSCNNSIYVSDVTIPDGTIMAPGTSFVKTWAFQNTGSCSWDKNYQLVFISGDQMGGMATTLTGTAAPSQQEQGSVSLIAPTTEGTYLGYWSLADAQGNRFGGSVTVKIVVSNSAITQTVTATPVLTATSTPQPSSTPTSLPSDTPTDTPTETASPAPTGTGT